MRRWGLIILAIAVYAAERGLDVSGIEYFPLSIGLWSLAGGLALVGLGMFVWPHVRRKDKSKVVGASIFAGHVYDGTVRVGAGHEVKATVGDHPSLAVATNGAGYYRDLQVKPPDASYIGFPIEFYVDGEKVSRTAEYGGSRHTSNRWDLQVQPSAGVVQANERDIQEAIGALKGLTIRFRNLKDPRVHSGDTVFAAVSDALAGGVIEGTPMKNSMVETLGLGDGMDWHVDERVEITRFVGAIVQFALAERRVEDYEGIATDYGTVDSQMRGQPPNRYTSKGTTVSFYLTEFGSAVARRLRP